MPTTARGIWTPSDTDAVDFTVHLATMAGTIDQAIDVVDQRVATVISRIDDIDAKQGWVTVSTGTLTQIGSSAIYGTVFNVSIPYILAPNERFDLSLAAMGNGYGFGAPANATGTVVGNNTNVVFRFQQTANGSAQNVLIVWRVVKQ